ncbi:ATP-binding protein [Candidatus Cloacimonadota bacterium]
MEKINQIILKNKKDEINHFNAILEEFGEKHEIPFRSNTEICLAVEEILMNIISYSHQDIAEYEIEVKWWLEDEFFFMEFTDDGIEFDPLKLPKPDLESSLEDRKIGGLGIYFVRKLMQDVKYRRENDKNILEKGQDLISI